MGDDYGDLHFAWGGIGFAYREQNSASRREPLRGSYTHVFFLFCLGDGNR